MSEVEPEGQEPEAQEPSEKKNSLSGLSEDEYIGMIAKLRQEAADKRVAKREAEKKNEEDAKKWQEYLDSQKSDFEKLMDEKKSLAEKLETMEKESIRLKIIAEFKLDEDQAEFVDGPDEKTMRKKAEKLSKMAPGKSPLDLRAGDRGGPIKPDASEGGAFLLGLADKL